MKINFSLKLTNETLTKLILDYYPKANIEHISRLDNKGTVTITGIAENTQQDINNIVKRASDNIADVKLKCQVAKVVKEIPKQIPIIEDKIEEDESEAEAFDFNTMLNRQISSHVKKAKKEINKLGNKLKDMIVKYDESTGNIEARTTSNTDNIEILNKSLLNLEAIIEKNTTIALKSTSDIISRIVDIENELQIINKCVDDTLSIFKNRKTK